MKVIKENLNEKKKRMDEAEAIRRRDQEQIELNMRLALEKEQAREDEMAQRGKRIQAVMDSMGDVIRDNEKERMREQERLYIQQCIEKDEKAHLQDIDRKNKDRLRHQQLNDDLTQQVREKQLKKESEARANAQYMNLWVEQTEQDNRNRQAQENSRKQKVLANQQYLMGQMKSGFA